MHIRNLTGTKNYEMGDKGMERWKKKKQKKKKREKGNKREGNKRKKEK